MIVLDDFAHQQTLQCRCCKLNDAKAYNYWRGTVVQVYFDGKKIGVPVDCYSPQISPEDPLDLGVHRLAVDQHTLALEITGAHAKAVQRHAAGVDFLKLEPVAPPE